MGHYWLIYQIALSKIFLKTVWCPNSFNKRPTTVWNIYFGPIEQTVCPNTTRRPTKIDVKRACYFFSLIPFGDKVLSFLIQSFLFPVCFIIPLGVMVNYGDLQFAERIMVARRSLLSGRSGLHFASLLWPFKRLLSCCLVSPMYWRSQIAHSRR
jgi:hypothetical protein